MASRSDAQIISAPHAMRAWSDNVHRAGGRIAFVPTMGYLHEGHVSLVRAAQARASHVVVSIFVNPTQFGPNEDLSRYPRDLPRDLAHINSVGADAVFTPTPQDIYPPGFDTYVVPSTLSTGLCGASRPDHFRGVCTVVAVLFRMTACDVALFGEKDFQQLQIIKRMTRDLWLDVEVVGLPIVREADGLAKSSRNVYLSAQERQDALVLSRALARVRARFDAGERHATALVQEAERLIGAVPSARIDYISIVDAANLQPVDTLTEPAVCALAVFIGKTRLIDNCLLG